MGRYKVSLKRLRRTSLPKFGIGLHYQDEIKTNGRLKAYTSVFPIASKKCRKMGLSGVEPGTSRTQSHNHATRPAGHFWWPVSVDF